jgi:hypothetical protein
LRVTGIFNDGNNVGTLLGHIDQVTTRAVREFNGIHSSLGPNDIGNVGDRGTGSSTEI